MKKPRFLQVLLYLISIFILQATCQVFTAQEKTDILMYHNQARAAVNPPASDMLTMVWNTTLESWAQSWVSGCQNTDSNTFILDHSPSNSRPGAGENIFASSALSGATPQGAVNSWDSEKSAYVYSTNYCSGQLYAANSPVWGDCGHYTQIAWASSYQLGCARAYCSNIQYGYSIVCNYSPAGNFYTLPTYEFKRPYATAAPGASSSPSPAAAASSSPTRTPSSSPSRTPTPGASPSSSPAPGASPSSSPAVGTSPSSSPDAGTGTGGKSGKKSNVAAVAGGVIAGSVVLLAGAGVAFFLIRRKKNAYQPSYYNPTGSSPTSTTPSAAPSSSSYSPSTPNKPVVVMATSDIQKSFMQQAPENSQTGYKPPVTSNAKPPVPSQRAPAPPVNNNNPFPVGSQCMARYTGDGQFYKAVIQQYNPSKGYLVRYPEYSSEEWLPLSSLKK